MCRLRPVFRGVPQRTCAPRLVAGGGKRHAAMNNSSFHRALVLTAWIAGLFCLVVCGVMVYEHFAAATNDPWKSPQLLALKEKLAADPKNEPLQSEIRQLDLKFRRQFRQRLALDKTGGWLLLGGALALALTAGGWRL